MYLVYGRLTSNAANADGTPCEELTASDGKCSVGTGIYFLKLRVTDGTCEEESEFHKTINANKNRDRYLQIPM